MLFPNHPTPADIQHYISSHEVVRRSRLLPLDKVQAVFRYGAIVGSVIHSYENLGRGMDQARLMIDEHERQGRSFASGTVILASSLSGGKGRFQRYWHAPSGGIWMTLVLVNTLLPEKSRLLPLLAGMACCETVNHFGVPGRIKWVNDVHVQGKKVAGILTETVFGRKTGEEYVLIGVGVNVNNCEFPEELQGLATSMRLTADRDFDLGQVATSLLANFSWYVGLLHYLEDLELSEDSGAKDEFEQFFLRRWQEMSDSMGRKVLFGYDVQKNPQYEAVLLGLESDGGLRLKNMEDHVELTEYGGEIVYND